MHYSPSLGDVSSTLIGSGISSGVNLGVGVASKSLGLASGAAGAASLATAGISAGIGVATSLISAWITSARLRGQQKIGSTNIANEIEDHLKQNKAAWDSSPQSLADYQAAQGNYDQLFALLESQTGCGNQQLGSAGQRCLSERMCTDGTCKYPWKTWYAIKPPAGITLDKLTGQVVVTDPTASAAAAAAAASQATGGISELTSGVPSWALMAGAGLLLISLVMD